MNLTRRTFVKFLAVSLPGLWWGRNVTIPTPPTTTETIVANNFYNRRLLQNASNKLVLRRYGELKISTTPLCEGVVPTASKITWKRYTRGGETNES